MSLYLRLRTQRARWRALESYHYHAWKSAPAGSHKRAYQHDMFVRAMGLRQERDRQIAAFTHVTRCSAAAVTMIASFEGGQSADGLFHAYWDNLGRVWTIGYGHTENVGPNTKSLTRVEAEALLQRDLDRKYAPYVRALSLPINQCQFDALVSFCYNLGPGYFARGHRMGDALRSHNWHAAADAFLLYDRAADGSHPPGLTRRREAERTLFLATPQ